jgi:hypothetical protein
MVKICKIQANKAPPFLPAVVFHNLFTNRQTDICTRIFLTAVKSLKDK